MRQYPNEGGLALLPFRVARCWQLHRTLPHFAGQHTVDGAPWKSVAFGGMVGVRRYTLFLRSAFEFA
jgi:hypothetical protein